MISQDAIVPSVGFLIQLLLQSEQVIPRFIKGVFYANSKQELTVFMAF
jgi:hypothetical protein